VPSKATEAVRVRREVRGHPVEDHAQQIAIVRANFVFVVRAGAHSGQKDFPDPAFPAQAHRVATAVPGIEIADDADPLRVRCPDRENRSGHAIDLAQVRTEAFEGPQVRAFGEQPDVHFTEYGRETIRVIGFLNTVFPVDPQAVGETVAAARHQSFEEAFDSFDLDMRQLGDLPPGFGLQDGHRAGTRLQTANP
jgi:hypothetical protein